MQEDFQANVLSNGGVLPPVLRYHSKVEILV